MKTFYTSVVELKTDFDGPISTHPFECGWADEAIFFVDVHEQGEETAVELRVQVSADGIRWMDEGNVVDIRDRAFIRLTHFGGFLRLTGTAIDAQGRLTHACISVRLALKG